jgi:hypothetical protein
VLERYGEVAHKASPTDYEAAVRDALSRLSPAEQAEFLRMLQERTGARGVTLPQPRPEAGGSGLDALARSVRELHEQPGRLRDVLTGPTGGGSSGIPTGEDVGPGGIPTGAGDEPAGVPPGLGSIFQSPLAKGAIAGITAMLVRKMLAPR